MRQSVAIVVACAAFAAQAQDETVVVSPHADDVAVTIYRDDLALVTETRTVTLPAGAVTLAFEGVVETLLPQSAIVTDTGRVLAESNFDFERLTPRTLLARSVGKTVTIVRSNPTTGRTVRNAATIVAVNNGVVLEIADGNEALYCSGLPERLELTEVPSGLGALPRLSAKLAAGNAGLRTVKISYLAHGFAWSTDYVAHLNEQGNAMSVAGWATVTNSTGSVFTQAEVQLVAGRLNLLEAEDGGSVAEPVYANDGESDADARARVLREDAEGEVALLRQCFPIRTFTSAEKPLPTQYFMMRLDKDAVSGGELEEIVVTGSRITREELGDYQLYRLPWRTDLAARQTKHVLFLDKPDVRVERLYGYRVESLTYLEDDGIAIPDLIVRFENDEASGLGEPLPRGTVRVFEPYAGRDVFAGEAEIGDRPAGLPVELTIGSAQNVLLTSTMDSSYRGRNEDRVTTSTTHRIVNNKGVPIDFEIRHGIEEYYANLALRETSLPMQRKYGDLAWRFVVQPGEAVLRYRLSARELSP